MKELNKILNGVDESWKELLEKALLSLDRDYLMFLKKNRGYFPDLNNFLNAFKYISLQDTKYILFGQDPYPRFDSAVGYAFIDGRVKEIFSNSGLSKEVNRATSLRNFIKMLLVCEGELKDDFSKEAISKIDTKRFCNSMDDLRKNFEKNGVLLLNMALIFTEKKDSLYHIKMWSSFIKELLCGLKDKNIELILFGKQSKEVIKTGCSKDFKFHSFEHPYNISFIRNPEVQKLFAPMKLLS